MLNDSEHASWLDPDVKAHVRDRVGGSDEAFRDAIALILSSLSALQKLGDDFGFIIKDADPGAPVEGKISRSFKEKISQKIELVFSKTRADELLTQLRRYTEDFRTLVEQTEPAQGRRGASKASRATKREVAKLSTIKDAASNLYQALGLACSVHAEHQAHLSLQTVHRKSSQVKFIIAYTQKNLQGATATAASGIFKGPVWLTIESAVSGTIYSSMEDVEEGTDRSDVLAALLTSSKRPHESLSPPPTRKLRNKLKKKPKNCVTFEPADSPPPLSMSSAPPVDSLTNFCHHSNFCTQLQRLVSRSTPRSDQPVGYLHCTGTPKHLVYIHSKTQTMSASSFDETPVSLRQLFAQTGHGNSEQSLLRTHQCIALARQLATAVLQFQATPWIEKSRDSDHVLVSNPNEDSKPKLGVAHESFVNVAIRGPLGPPSRSTTFPSTLLIRNCLLFRLGVMLLELAHQRTLSDLCYPADVDANDDANTEYHTADRLQRQVSKILGPRYAEVARKCIDCDSGHGYDLGKAELQQGFYQDVVSELEDLEKIFRNFSLNT